MLNRCTFIGHLGADPESRSFANGGKVVALRLAVSERWKDKASGEQKERTEWVAVQIFNENIGAVAERYLRKGSKCFVEGKMQTRKWQDQSGTDKFSTEIVIQGFDGKLILLDAKGAGGDGDVSNKSRMTFGGAGGNDGPVIDPDLDDLPFMSCDMAYEGRVG